MAHARGEGRQPAHGVVRHRRPAGRRGDDHARPVPVDEAARSRVTVFHAPDCQLCARALEVVEAARAELGFELELVDVAGDRELEAAYREHLPVVEIDGVVAFTYFVDGEALRARLAG